MSVFSHGETTNTPNSQFLMGLAPTNCVSAGEDTSLILTTKESADYDMQVLRRLAAKAEHPEIKGRGCPEAQLREYFRGQTLLSDFSND